MPQPQLVILDKEKWVTRQLVPLAGESRWLIRKRRKADAALSLAREPRPAVLFVRVDPGAEKADGFALIADVHRLSPDVPVVAVSDVKLSEGDRAAWTAVLFDIGARYVLFPPLTRPVLEDVASGLMTAAVRRCGGTEPPLIPAEDVIDLADEEAHG